SNGVSGPRPGSWHRGRAAVTGDRALRAAARRFQDPALPALSQRALAALDERQGAQARSGRYHRLAQRKLGPIARCMVQWRGEAKSVKDDGSVLSPQFKTTPYWWEAAPPEDASGQALPESADVAIVGSGYTGLCCALELADAGGKPVVLEAGPLGAGASTRSGAMVTGGQKFVVSGA